MGQSWCLEDGDGAELMAGGAAVAALPPSSVFGEKRGARSCRGASIAPSRSPPRGSRRG